MKAGRSDAAVRDACFYVGAWAEDVGAWAAENAIAAPKDVLSRGDVKLCGDFNAE
ncbi:hypothetical protein GCWU000325_01530 [Alloprevotella tannerae ATCC 51259]|uniref:Uncharacterized protein n=1 Tax=Alloprevotella tannerae ATCC 51259 TaxID=626522 RepID=C9LH29_9BACT|nr:hypothetical protein GCWU000325_01530 [Alloprevotella tannerae ATCC 51259]